MADENHVSIRIPRDIYNTVSEIASTQERSVSAEVRRIVKNWLAEQPTQKAA
jgi:predicted transcriptional regulator